MYLHVVLYCIVLSTEAIACFLCLESKVPGDTLIVKFRRIIVLSTSIIKLIKI